MRRLILYSGILLTIHAWARPSISTLLDKWELPGYDGSLIIFAINSGDCFSCMAYLHSIRSIIDHVPNDQILFVVSGIHPRHLNAYAEQRMKIDPGQYHMIASDALIKDFVPFKSSAVLLVRENRLSAVVPIQDAVDAQLYEDYAGPHLRSTLLDSTGPVINHIDHMAVVDGSLLLFDHEFQSLASYHLAGGGLRYQYKLPDSLYGYLYRTFISADTADWQNVQKYSPENMHLPPVEIINVQTSGQAVYVMTKHLYAEVRSGKSIILMPHFFISELDTSLQARQFYYLQPSWPDEWDLDNSNGWWFDGRMMIGNIFALDSIPPEQQYFLARYDVVDSRIRFDEMLPTITVPEVLSRQGLFYELNRNTLFEYHNKRYGYHQMDTCIYRLRDGEKWCLKNDAFRLNYSAAIDFNFSLNYADKSDHHFRVVYWFDRQYYLAYLQPDGSMDKNRQLNLPGEAQGSGLPFAIHRDRLYTVIQTPEGWNRLFSFKIP